MVGYSTLSLRALKATGKGAQIQVTPPKTGTPEVQAPVVITQGSGNHAKFVVQAENRGTTKPVVVYADANAPGASGTTISNLDVDNMKVCRAVSVTSTTCVGDPNPGGEASLAFTHKFPGGSSMFVLVDVVTNGSGAIAQTDSNRIYVHFRDARDTNKPERGAVSLPVYTN